MLRFSGLGVWDSSGAGGGGGGGGGLGFGLLRAVGSEFRQGIPVSGPCSAGGGKEISHGLAWMYGRGHPKP